MKPSNGKLRLQPLALVAFVGFIYFNGIQLFWGYFPDINPVFQALLACCASSNWLTSAVYVHDVLINVLLLIPLALFIVKLNVEPVWFFILTAIVPNFVLGLYPLFNSVFFDSDLSIYFPGWAVELLCLPIAFLLLTLWRKYNE